MRSGRIAAHQRRCEIEDDPSLPRRRWQFTLGTLLFLMTAVAFLAGILAGMLNPSIGVARLPRAFFVVLIIAFPVGLMLAVWLVVAIRQWLRDRRLPPDD